MHAVAGRRRRRRPSSSAPDRARIRKMSTRNSKLAARSIKAERCRAAPALRVTERTAHRRRRRNFSRVRALTCFSWRSLPNIPVCRALGVPRGRGRGAFRRPVRGGQPHQPAGDQPAAIDELERRIRSGERDIVLLGATGTGKSATTAWLIERLQRPTLVMAPNKTLAAQLANELREMLPHNAVEYFVSRTTTTTSPRRTSRRPTPTSRRTARSTTTSSGCGTRRPRACCPGATWWWSPRCRASTALAPRSPTWTARSELRSATRCPATACCGCW